MKEIKIVHRSTREVLFSYSCEDNTIKTTLERAINLGSDLSGSDLSGSDLSGSDLSCSDLSRSNLSGSDLSGSDLSGSDLSGSNLSDSDLSRSNLSGSDLSRSDLSGSELSGSDLSGSDLSGSDLSRSNLSGSDLRGVIGNGEEVKSLQINHFNAVFTKDTLAIGCQQHLIVEWKIFSDSYIKKMDRVSLVAWLTYKKILFKLIKISNSEPIGRRS